ncbi:hypothetical protein BU16DRAFT_620150 [Lophium mytilinum]|uniref:Uncharacterized protein n=1 Tax=Lophium mytilinum TaxID=390894 RepID=A0A6A6QKR5_9PEZI|nr:hypothetical protein BU16DRAFT_620150 [Lophium mytilinum]
MGTCGSALKCDTCYYNTTKPGCTKKTVLETDGDIVGKGVLASFLISAGLTCGAILYGHFSDSLPDSDLNSVDREFIKFFRGSFVYKKILPYLDFVRFWRFIKSVLLAVVTFGKKKYAYPPALQKEERSEALKRFVLALSDQQLVTGLALVVAVVSNRCEITFYEFRVVIGLAWFSATTHLGTLYVLKDYLIEHPTVRNWRVLGIVVTMVLLIFAIVVNEGSDTTVFGRPDLLVNTAECALISITINERAISLLLPTLAMISIPYISRISVLFTSQTDDQVFEAQVQQPSKSPEGPKTHKTHAGSVQTSRQRHERTQTPSASRWRDRKILRELRRRFKHKIIDTDVVHDIYFRVKAVENSPAERVKRWEWEWERGQSHTRQFFMREYQQSYLSNVPPLLFFFAYGSAQTISVRWLYAPRMGETASRMDFG